MRRHVMIDLETLATTPDAVITEIGAVRFDETGIDSDDLELLVEPVQQAAGGRRIDNATLTWWAGQDVERLAGFFKHTVSLPNALARLTEYVASAETIWACGTDFDVAILAHAYRQQYMPIPWHFGAARDFRTVKRLFGGGTYSVAGPSHRAVCDAAEQAQIMAMICADHEWRVK